MTVATGKHHDEGLPRRRLAVARDVADMLSLPLTSLYDHARSRSIPGVVRIGRRVLFDLDKIEEYIAAGGDQSGETA